VGRNKYLTGISANTWQRYQHFQLSDAPGDVHVHISGDVRSHYFLCLPSSPLVVSGWNGRLLVGEHKVVLAGGICWMLSGFTPISLSSFLFSCFSVAAIWTVKTSYLSSCGWRRGRYTTSPTKNSDHTLRAPDAEAVIQGIHFWDISSTKYEHNMLGSI